MHQDKFSSSIGSLSHCEHRVSQMLIEAIQLSYTTLDKTSILQALKILLNAYQTQVIGIYEELSLKRDRQKDLNWIDNIIELCLD